MESMRDLIPAEYAVKIYAILVKHCGAPDNERDKESFVYHAVNKGISEYRVCYALGFGGKFWNNNNRWYVNCYKEKSDERKEEIIETANAELALLREEFLKIRSKNTNNPGKKLYMRGLSYKPLLFYPH